MTLTVGSLFSGIGGLDLGLERAGMNVIWQSEIDPYATRVLAKHWPGVPNHGDITRINWPDIVRPDVICGGYPCQPFSTAGKRRGEHDPRHLWPYVRDAISHLRPRYAILENVRGHLSLGGLSVISEITALGYCAEWRIISAASVGANHRRDRLFIVAYPNGQDESDVALNGERQKVFGLVAYPDGSSPTNGRQRPPISGQDRSRRDDRGGSYRNPREIAIRSAGEDCGLMADADDARSRTPGRNTERERPSSVKGRQELAQPRPGRRGTDLADTAEQRLEERSSAPPREVFASDARRRITDLGSVANWWTTEPDVGRVAHGIPSRVDRLKGLGNAVVPQVAEVIGRLVIAHNEQNPD